MTNAAPTCPMRRAITKIGPAGTIRLTNDASSSTTRPPRMTGLARLESPTAPPRRMSPDAPIEARRTRVSNCGFSRTASWTDGCVGSPDLRVHRSRDEGDGADEQRAACDRIAEQAGDGGGESWAAHVGDELLARSGHRRLTAVDARGTSLGVQASAAGGVVKYPRPVSSTCGVLAEPSGQDFRRCRLGLPRVQVRRAMTRPSRIAVLRRGGCGRPATWPTVRIVQVVSHAVDAPGP